MKGKKSEYLCKMKFECMSCGKKDLSENRTLHIKISHKGDKNVKFKIISDSNQPCLSFMSAPSQKDTNCIFHFLFRNVRQS